MTGHLANIGHKLGVSSRPATVHAALYHGQAQPPDAPGPPPSFTWTELRLLRAVAEHSQHEQIAPAAQVALAEVDPQVHKLVAKAQAANPTHLVGLAHSWGLLDAIRPYTTVAAATVKPPLDLPRIPRSTVLTGTEAEAFEKKVIAAYGRRYSIRDISRASGRSYGVIRKILAEADVRFRNRGYQYPTEVDHDEHEMA